MITERKLFLLIALLFSALTLFGQNTKLTIKITNIKEPKGKIEIGLYNNGEKFPEVGGELKKIILDADSSTVIYTIENLPEGNYAVAVYHDENSDGECNTNFLGIPKEPYGFSNNVRPLFSAPSFKKTKFTLKGSVTITIKLI